jgi:acetyl esterase/lipase
MNKHGVKGWAQYLSDSRGAVKLSIVVRVFIVIAIAFITTFNLTQHTVSAAQSATTYCSGLYSGDQERDCEDGSRGADCSEYQNLFNDAGRTGACNKGHDAKASGAISDTAATSTTTTTSASSDVCSSYNGTLLQACQGGKIYGCNPSAATTDASLYAACQAGSNQAGQSSSSTKNTTAYKNAVLNACGQYQNNVSSWASCVAGGMNGNGNTTPSVSDCVTNPKITDQSACSTGAQAGSNYFQNNANSNSNNPFQSQDQQDGVNNLSSLIDVLHSQGSDSKTDTSTQSDNNFGSYVNGAGKQQPIKVMACKSDAKTDNAAGSGTDAVNGLTQDQVKDAVTQALQQNSGGSGGGSGGTGSTGNDSSAGVSSLAQTISGLLGGSNGSGGTGDVSNVLGNSSNSNNNGSSSITNTSSIASAISSVLSGVGGTGSTGSNGSSSTGSSAGGLTGLLNNAQGISALTNAIQGTQSGGADDTAAAAAVKGKKCPAIVFFNGGGWHSDDGTSDKVATGAANDGDDQDKGAKPAGGGANERGYTAIEVTYRLGSSGVNYMFEDVMRGLRHVINNASKYGIDSSKVAISGDSAGGSLSMRVAASGKSGAKAAVGWSAPTNAFTALFKSYKSFLIGLDHSTCAPTDLAGLTNTLSGINGGSINVAQYGQGIGSNDFSALGISQGENAGLTGFSAQNIDPVGSLTQVLAAAQQAQTASKNWEAISNALQQSSQSDADKEKNAVSILQDTNKDGTVSADELAAYNATVKSAADTDGDGNVSAAEQSAYTAARDTNKDGSVSAAEDLAFQVAKIKKDEDTDGNGTISDEEAAAYQAKLQTLEDANGDGTVSPDEVAGYNQNNPAQAEAQKPIADLEKGVINLSAQKMGECFQNFIALSPALFASPDTPPSFIAGFDNDDLIDPSQAHDMADKLNSMGVRAETLILPGDPNAEQVAFGATKNHLGYDQRFVCPTLNFLDSILQPDKVADQIDCATGKRPSESKPAAPAASAPSGGQKAGKDCGTGSTNSSGGCTCPKGSTTNNNGSCYKLDCAAGGFGGKLNDAGNGCKDSYTTGQANCNGTWHDDVHGGYCQPSAPAPTHDCSSYTRTNGNCRDVGDPPRHTCTYLELQAGCVST